MNRYVLPLLWMIIGLTLMTACSSMSSQNNATSVPAPTTIVPTMTKEPGFLPGTYTKTLTKADIPTPDLEGNIGDWRYAFTTNDATTGTYKVELTTGGETIVVANGKYTITGDQITFQDDSEVCMGKEGSYRWNNDGKQLTFETITDTCEHRKLVSTTHPLILQP